jgi:hypothetical protein
MTPQPDQSASTRARCARCGYCADEDLTDLAQVENSTARTWGWCKVCEAETTHWIEELADPRALDQEGQDA